MVVMAVMSESSSSRFSFSFLTRDSMARLEKDSVSPPWRWHIRLCTMDRHASAEVGAPPPPPEAPEDEAAPGVGVDILLVSLECVVEVCSGWYGCGTRHARGDCAAQAAGEWAFLW